MHTLHYGYLHLNTNILFHKSQDKKKQSIVAFSLVKTSTKTMGFSTEMPTNSFQFTRNQELGVLFTMIYLQ